MINIIYTILLFNILIIIFKMFEKYKVDNLQALIVNYLTAAGCSYFVLKYFLEQDSLSMYIYSKMDLSSQSFAYNNSPVFEDVANVLGFLYQSQTFDFHAVDVDGDSLYYSLITPLNNASTPVTYLQGLSATQPFWGSVSFDNQTGLLTVTDSIAQVSIVSVLVEEYRAGNLIGSIRRDIQMHLIADTNHIPSLTGIDSSNVYTLTVFEGDTVDFDLYTHDTSPPDSTYLKWNSGIPDGIFTINPGKYESADFYWETDSTDVQFGPHLFKVTVRDDHCPLNALKTQFFKIFVLAKDTVNVWPGDANNDHMADLYDVLPIGVGYNATGSTRANATTNWAGQSAVDWNGSFASGLNYKFADCNGDGTIDTLDLDAITLNYGMTHARITLQNPNAADPELYMTIDADTFYPGDWVTGSIYLGSASNTINDFYGLTFGLNYDNSLIDASTVEINFQNNWAGQLNADLITYTNNLISSGSIKSAIVRTDQQNKSGFGKIGTFKAKIKDQPAPGWNDLNFSFTDLKMIDVAEQPKSVSTFVDDSKVSSNPVGIDLLSSVPLNVFPNPAKDRIIVESGEPIQQIVVLDIQGKEVHRQNGQFRKLIEMDLPDLNNGYYLVRVYFEKSVQVKQLTIGK